jgi:hypothetical protein
VKFFKTYRYLFENSFKKNMNKNQNVVEDALFQIKNLEETLKENAKGILQSTMTEEIKQLVKESLKEAKDEEEIEEQEPMAGEEELDTETEVEDEDMDDEMGAEEDMDDEEMDMGDEEMDMDDEEMDVDDEETIDLTDASDDEVLRVFKAMGDEDGIVVKKEGGNVHFTDGDNEYMIQLGESEMDDELYEMEDELDEEMEDEMLEDMDMEDEVEETIYEIVMDDEDDDSELDEWSWGGAAMGAVKGGLGLEEDDMEMDFETEMDEEDEMEFGYEMSEEDDMDMDSEMDEEEEMDIDMEAVMEAVKKSIKPKGVGIGHGPKFNYDKKPNMDGGFDEKKKEAFGKGVKAMGTGKAKFEYKEEKNYGSNKHEFKRKKVNGVEKKAGDVKGHYKTYEKKETKEAARTYGSGSKDGSRGLRKARLNNRNMSFDPFKLHESASNEVQLLREKNEEYKKALDVFRTKLNEVAVFNSNLAYATRLFTEHSTTKQEKINVLRRFDNVESLKESKNLYRTIKEELSSPTGSNGEQKLTESIERKVNNSVQTGSSSNLIESKTYENPQFLRMKDLMGKLK